MSFKTFVTVVLFCMLASQTYATSSTALPACESDGSSGICSQVLTVFCLISSCTTCCQHTSTCPPSPSFVPQVQCPVATTSRPKPTTVTPMVVTHGPCAAILCTVGRSCVNVGGFAICEITCSQPISCFAHPCSVSSCPANPQATCIPNFCGGCYAHYYVNGANVTDACSIATKPPTTAAAVTTRVPCGPVCGIFCQYGNVRDANGCPLCKCKPPPTTAVTTSVPVTVATTRRPSPTPAITTTRVSCGPVCHIFCQYGNVLDDRGCPLCKCKPQPTTTSMPVTCGPLCRKLCPFGYVLDVHGCPTCQCKPPPSTGLQATTTKQTPMHTAMHTSNPPRTGSPTSRPPRTGSPTSRPPRTGSPTSRPPRTGSPTSRMTSPGPSTGPPNPCANIRCAGGPCVNVGGYAVCTHACSTFVVCLTHPCSVTTCPGYPTASCLANYCGGCNAHFYVGGVNVTATCSVPPPSTAIPVTATVTCRPCAVKCANGLSADSLANGCSKCTCNPPEVKMTRVTLVVNLGKSLFDALEQTGDAQLSSQVQKQLHDHFKLADSQLQNFTVSSKHSDGVYSARVAFNVYGVESEPNPAVLVQNIREALSSKSLQLEYSANGQVYPMPVSDTYTDSPQSDPSTDGSSDTLAIAVGVAVPVALILFAVLGFAVYRARKGRAAPGYKDESALMSYNARSGSAAGISSDEDLDVAASCENPTYVAA